MRRNFCKRDPHTNAEVYQAFPSLKYYRILRIRYGGFLPSRRSLLCPRSTRPAYGQVSGSIFAQARPCCTRNNVFRLFFPCSYKSALYLDRSPKHDRSWKSHRVPKQPRTMYNLYDGCPLAHMSVLHRQSSFRAYAPTAKSPYPTVQVPSCLRHLKKFSRTLRIPNMRYSPLPYTSPRALYARSKRARALPRGCKPKRRPR